MKKAIFLLSLVLILSVGFFSTTTQIFAESLSNKLKGKILLQVESRGEAWYVSPADGKRYSMGKPKDAFDLIRKLGIGISNDNLKKIQIADENLVGLDSDNDGLSDMAEDSIGTDKNNKDSDGDGYDDKKEVINGYNPIGAGKILIDSKLAKQQSGKILLQVESKGEAWYVNPKNNQRIFLGRPTDAFNLMRKLGLGISNNDLSKIVIQSNAIIVHSIGIKEAKIRAEKFINEKLLSSNVTATIKSIVLEGGLYKIILEVGNSEYTSYMTSDGKKFFQAGTDLIKEKPIEINDLDVCDKMQDQSKKYECYYEIAIDKQDSSICDKIQNQDDKGECYSYIAEAKQDLTICDKIQNQDDKDMCYYTIVIIKRDLAGCGKIQSQIIKGGCYTSIAVVGQDCDEIQNQDDKDMCYMAYYGKDVAENKARDAKRISDIKQIQTGLELYYNDMSTYPNATKIIIKDLCLSANKDLITGNGFYSSCVTGGIKYMSQVPTAPLPVDGSCTADNNQYIYLSTNEEGTVICKTGTQQAQCQNYMLQFCTGESNGLISAGLHCATSSGISNKACSFPVIK